MASIFKALPVKKGDSFLLLRDGKKILFDGGSSQTHLIKLLKNLECKEIELDLVVCSHNDSDHSKGIIGLLKHGVKIHEMWLPAVWKTFYLNLQNPNFVRKLLKDDRNTYLDLNEKLLSSEYFEVIEIEKGSDIEPIDDSICNFQCLCNYKYFTEFLKYKRKKSKTHKKIIDDSLNIFEIIIWCTKSGIPIRFFKYDMKQPSGGETWLTPYNCKEVSGVSFKKSISPQELLFLTTINKESLAFISRAKDEPSVFFTAETLVTRLPPITSNYPLITAPHHGSKDNDIAYKQNFSTPTWIRSDSNNKSRPCLEYIRQKLKYCTICNNGIGVHREIEFIATSSSWKTSAAPCLCK